MLSCISVLAPRTPTALYLPETPTDEHREGAGQLPQPPSTRRVLMLFLRNGQFAPEAGAGFHSVLSALVV